MTSPLTKLNKDSILKSRYMPCGKPRGLVISHSQLDSRQSHIFAYQHRAPQRIPTHLDKFASSDRRVEVYEIATWQPGRFNKQLERAPCSNRTAAPPHPRPTCANYSLTAHRASARRRRRATVRSKLRATCSMPACMPRRTKSRGSARSSARCASSALRSEVQFTRRAERASLWDHG